MTASVITDLKQLLKAMMYHQASDCYITEGAPCMLRIDGRLRSVGSKLAESEVKTFVSQAMDIDTEQKFYAHREANFAIVSEYGRFRVSAFWQRDLPGMVIRRIETTIPDLHKLGLPEVMQDLSIAKRGLVLIVGATGSVKSTSMAAILVIQSPS